AIDNRSAESTPVAVTVQIEERVNQSPSIGSVSGPGSVAMNSSFTLQASDVVDPDGTVDQVKFYLDSNSDGQLDANDLSLGIGTLSGQDWRKTISTTGWTPGQAIIFAEATDNGSPLLQSVQSFVINVTNSAPTGFDIPNLMTNRNTATPKISFSIGDQE